MNVNMMLRVAAHIEAHPEGYNQSAWCGTSCCIAGTAVMLDMGLPDGVALLDRVTRDVYSNSVASLLAELSIPYRAQRVLGVDNDTATRLFGPALMWPEAYRRFDYPHQHLQAAAYLRALVAEYEATLVPLPIVEDVAPVEEEELVLA